VTRSPRRTHAQGSVDGLLIQVPLTAQASARTRRHLTQVLPESLRATLSPPQTPGPVGDIARDLGRNAPRGATRRRSAPRIQGALRRRLLLITTTAPAGGRPQALAHGGRRGKNRLR